MKNDSLRSINEAGLGKRLVALVMDIAFAFLTFGLLATQITSRIAVKGMHVSDKAAKALNYEVCSMLYVCETEEEDGAKRVVTPKDLDQKFGDNTTYTVLYNYKGKDIDFYKERLKYYYLNYKTGLNVECPEGKNFEDFCAPNYKDKIGDKLPSEIYTEAWFDENFGSKTDVEDFVNKEVYTAVKELNESDYFVKLNNSIKRIQLFIILPPFVLTFGVFFILIPALFENGETLGKKFMHIGFVTKDGYGIKKRQIILRQVILFLYVTLCAFVIGIGVTSIATLGVGVVIYLVATLISKSKRSPADYFAYTLLIDTRTSVWFKDEFEEEIKETELTENMKQYRKAKVIDKSVIQVGGEIINEDIKREIEEENSKISEK